VHSFADKEGRQWTFEINWLTATTCLKSTGWDLFNILKDGLDKVSALLNDPLEMMSVFTCLLDEQLKAHAVSPEEFARSFSGDVVEDSARAFCEALADFFPSRKGQLLRGLLEKGKEIEAVMMAKASSEMETLKSIDSSAIAEQVLSGQAS
jgi:hypothetical protein